MMKGLFALVLAGSVVIPLPAGAGQNIVKPSGNAASAAFEALPLPPIPHAETIPWLAARSATRQQSFRVLLHAGSFENLRLVLDRDAPKAPTTFTSMQGGSHAGS